jgi:hypothetical protein
MRFYRLFSLRDRGESGHGFGAAVIGKLSISPPVHWAAAAMKDPTS